VGVFRRVVDFWLNSPLPDAHRSRARRAGRCTITPRVGMGTLWDRYLHLAAPAKMRYLSATWPTTRPTLLTKKRSDNFSAQKNKNGALVSSRTEQ